MLNVKLYRHKTEKDVYLMRDWAVCGGGPDTPFYKATTNPIEAILNTSYEKVYNKGFEDWFNSMGGNLYVKYTKEKEMEFDGYKGKLQKEIKLYVRDFEKIVLTEGENGNAY